METTDKSAARRRRAYWFLVGTTALFGAAVLLGATAGFLLRLREAARNERCENNLRRIYQAFAEYADANRTYPPAFTTDAEGRKLHSWRVLLLPYLDEEALFAQIRLDEPWDSDWNSQFHSQTPNVFKCASTPENLGDKNCRCAFSVVVGEGGEGGRIGALGEVGGIGEGERIGEPGEVGEVDEGGRIEEPGEVGEVGRIGEPGGVGEVGRVEGSGVETAFRADGTSVAPEDLRDGAANTVLCVERKSPVCWMAPDVELTATRVLAENETPVRERVDFGSRHGRGGNVLMFDGSTRFLSEKLDGGVLRLLLGIADSTPSSANGDAKTPESEPSGANGDAKTPEIETSSANGDAKTPEPEPSGANGDAKTPEPEPSGGESSDAAEN